MMPLRRFTIHQPKNLAEASQMLGEFGEKARLYAGGTELLLAMKHDLLRYEHLVDVKTLPGLDKIEAKNGSLLIGSAVTHRAIERSAAVKEKLPVLAEMETKVANVRVRATGTLGGNLALMNFSRLSRFRRCRSRSARLTSNSKPMSGRRSV